MESTIEPGPALAAEALTLERTLSDLVNQAYALTPSGIALMWKNAPLRARNITRAASSTSGRARKQFLISIRPPIT